MTTLRIDGNSAYLISRATPRILAILGGIEGRRSWLLGGTQLKVESTKHNIDLLLSLGDVEIETVGKVVPELEAFAFVTPYKEKMPSLPHQLACKAKMKGKKVFGVFFEQGLGKTKSLLDKAGELYCEGKITGLIVVSVKGVSRQWILSQAPQHLGCKWSGTSWPCTSEQLPKKGLQIFAINYDGLASKRGMAVAKEFAERHNGRLMIVADESQCIKNQNSARYAAMMEIRPYSSYRFLSTGTPIAKDLLDEKNQLDWLDPNIIGIRYKTTFLREFANLGGFAGKQILSYRNIEKFKEKTEPYTIRVTKEEFGLAPKQYDTWVIDLLPEQKNAIKQIKDDLEITINDKTIDIATAVVALSKISQIGSGFIIDENKKSHLIIPAKDNPRLEALSDWIASDDGKAIVWFKFRMDAKLICERLKQDGISFVEYHGGVNDSDREKSIDSFMSVNGARILVANPQSASTGLNLQGLTNRALYYTNSYRAIDRWQSEDRIHRIGMNGIITITDIVARGSVDAAIIANLKKKTGVSQMALGDLINIIGGI